MKVNVDYEIVLSAIDNLENGEDLSSKELSELITVLKAIQGDYIPTREELEMQHNNVEKLSKIDMDKNPDLFDRIYNQSVKFENKYC